METCYKCFRREVLQRIAIEEDRFGVEVEITAKLAAMGARVREVPISYRGPDRASGKKIGVGDGVDTMGCLLRYWWRLRHDIKRGRG